MFAICAWPESTACMPAAELIGWITTSRPSFSQHLV